jgi:uncharacterized protein (DUF1697 family)
MDRYVAFLRGMNLGNRRIKNKELRAHFEGLGCEEVATFRASGNVVFERDETPAKLTSCLEEGLAGALGYEVPVFLRSAEELLAIASYRPFDAELVEASKGKLQVALLAKKPSAAAAKWALSLSSEADRLAIEGRELYWLPSGGISESELDLKTAESAVGPWTMRTKGTIEQIVARYLS